MATTGHVSTNPASKSDPLLTFMFSVKGNINGVGDIEGYFTEISGPKEECEVVAFKTVGFESNERGKPKKFQLPGRNSREPITLKRGITNDMTFWNWWQLVKQGRMSRAKINVTITMYNRTYKPLIQWDLENAWPYKIAAPDFQAGSSDFGLEEITLVYSRLNFNLAG